MMARKTKVVGDGLQNTLKCDKCGHGLQVTTPWSELIYMSMRRLPTNNSWLHDPHSGCFVPNTRCPRCGDPVRLGLTPDECARHIKSGVLGGKIREADVATYAQRIAGGG